MPHNNIHIGELTIRVPGMSRREAERLGQQVAQQLSTTVPASARETDIAALNVRIANPHGSSHDDLAHTIAENIARRIR